MIRSAPGGASKEPERLERLRVSDRHWRRGSSAEEQGVRMKTHGVEAAVALFRSGCVSDLHAGR